MPTYEYACRQCGHRVEVVQSLSDEPLKTCGVCGGELRKVFHPAGVLFKGSGFYSTDNRAKPKESSASGREPSKDGGDRSAKSDGGGSREGTSAPTGDGGSTAKPASSASGTSGSSGSSSDGG